MVYIAHEHHDHSYIYGKLQWFNPWTYHPLFDDPKTYENYGKTMSFHSIQMLLQDLALGSVLKKRRRLLQRRQRFGAQWWKETLRISENYGFQMISHDFKQFHMISIGHGPHGHYIKHYLF